MSLACGRSVVYERQTAEPTRTPDVDLVSFGDIQPRSLQGGEQLGRSIVGGYSALEGSQPWLVAVGRRRRGQPEWLCGGSLVSGTVVVTGAHCTLDTAVEEMVVSAGDNTVGGGEMRRVAEVVVHPGWEDVSGWTENDIAVLVLETSLNLGDKIRPICLPPFNSYLEVRICFTNINIFTSVLTLESFLSYVLRLDSTTIVSL